MTLFEPTFFQEAVVVSMIMAALVIIVIFIGLSIRAYKHWRKYRG